MPTTLQVLIDQAQEAVKNVRKNVNWCAHLQTIIANHKEFTDCEQATLILFTACGRHQAVLGLPASHPRRYKDLTEFGHLAIDCWWSAFDETNAEPGIAASRRAYLSGDALVQGVRKAKAASPHTPK